jgi:hypothetical protein
MPTFKVKAKVWRYPGPGGWRFVSLSKKDSKALRTLAKNSPRKRGAWGYIKVQVKIGKSTWYTGVWPQPKAEIYLLPLKAEIRKKEGIKDGDAVYALVTPQLL